MSIAEKAGEISGNNATIAESLQKVYDAGLKAGLAQDPDYAEGYKDGVESGILWDALMSGESPVGKAREADRATEAVHASLSDLATLATKADHSASADRATNADHATNADKATEADHATTATTATTAESAQALASVLPVALGGTGESTVEGILATLGLTKDITRLATGSVTAVHTVSPTRNILSIALDFTPKLIVAFHSTMGYLLVWANGAYMRVSGATTTTSFDTKEAPFTDNAVAMEVDSGSNPPTYNYVAIG